MRVDTSSGATMDPATTRTTLGPFRTVDRAASSTASMPSAQHSTHGDIDTTFDTTAFTVDTEKGLSFSTKRLGEKHLSEQGGCF